MLQNPNFPGSSPDLAEGAYSAPPESLAGGEGACSPRIPHLALSPAGLELWPFGPRFYRLQGLTHYRVGNPTCHA